jgi:hypothetical protein
VTTTTGDEQRRIVLTAHPLQRIGGYAFARLGRMNDPESLPPEAFEAITNRMTGDAERAALIRESKKPEGFWLKCSLSLSPNSPMNHPSNGKKPDQTIRAAVRGWRTQPDPAQWPDAACVLCGRGAVGFFGKRDIPLAESDIYRNTTPRGHAGMALCWPCVCCFYALPYGCRLTGGPAIALHSWDERFLLKTVSRRVVQNSQIIEAGQDTTGTLAAREVLALRALRHYELELTAGVDLLVFSNNNRGQTLDIHSMDQPLAEWLRKTIQRGGFVALLRAHRSTHVSGASALARNAFRAPDRIVSACAQYLAGPAAEDGRIRPDVTALAALSFSYVKEVMAMDEPDLKEIKATASRVAELLSREVRAGALTEFYSQSKDQKRLRSWLQRQAVDWALDRSHGSPDPLLTTYGFELLFQPGADSRAWFHRQMLLIAVLEELHRRGWQPADGKAAAEEIRTETDEDRADRAQIEDEGTEENP